MKILDTTLRDGSYVVDFNITPQQTFEISKALDEEGIEFIEIGHGLGLNAANLEGMKSDYSDESHLEAASSAIKKAVWGTFFIPGIGRKEDIDLALKYKMPMLRVGGNINEYEKTESFIRYAKEKGMFVCANFMKTYALSYEEAGKVAGQASEYGADLMCIVDSAGAMLPEDVTGYVNAIRKYTDKQIGFHGHNNLGLAISNSIRAVEEKVDVIDVSLRGMGRSAGNTVSEIFLLVLNRMGYSIPYDIYKLMDISEKCIDGLMKGYTQVDSKSILSGYSKFHSSFQPKLDKYANQYGVDVRKLMVELCKIDCISATDDLIMQLASKMTLLNESK